MEPKGSERMVKKEKKVVNHEYKAELRAYASKIYGYLQSSNPTWKLPPNISYGSTRSGQY